MHKLIAKARILLVCWIFFIICGRILGSSAVRLYVWCHIRESTFKIMTQIHAKAFNFIPSVSNDKLIKSWYRFMLRVVGGPVLDADCVTPPGVT